jgi:hypothetical protein
VNQISLLDLVDNAAAAHDMPAPSSFDRAALSISGGIDSLCIAILTRDRARAEGWLDRLVLVHADLPEMEHEGHAALIERQAAWLGLPLYLCRRTPPAFRGDELERLGPDGGLRGLDTGSLRSQERDRAHWSIGGPGAPCQGTSDHKRGPIWTVYTALANEFHGNKRGPSSRPCTILEIRGEARHEGGPGGKRDRRLGALERATIGGRWEARPESPNQSGRRSVTTWYPLADMAQAEVWTIVREAGAGHLIPTTYDRLPRYSCGFCRFASRDAINVQAQIDPEGFAYLLESERDYCGDWRREWSLRDVATDLAAGRLVEKATKWDDQA